MQPATSLQNRIELIAVEHEEALAARRAVHPLAMHFHPSMHEGRERSERGIVVARNVEQACASAPFGEQQLHDARVGFGPKKPLAQAQRVDDVADENDGVRVDRLQEVSKFRGAGALEAKMNIREKQSPHMTDGCHLRLPNGTLERQGSAAGISDS
jgi:hypothetical protein